MDDYNAFKSTMNNSEGGCEIGCLSPGVIAFLVILLVIYLIGKLG